MLFKNVFFESPAFSLSPQVVTSAEVEQRLSSVYQQLNIPFGTLESLTGVKERHLWPKNSFPSTLAAEAGEKALLKSKIPREEIDLLIYTGVSRDYLEPATACVVHKLLGLSPRCLVFDLSNACLGFINGMYVAANHLEHHICKNALIVTGENASALYDETATHLANFPTEPAFRQALASLTLGSAALALVMTGPDNATQDSHALLGATSRIASEYYHLCRAEGSYFNPSMQTQTGELMKQGLELAAHCWDQFLTELNWQKHDPKHIFNHQVSEKHHYAFFDKLSLDKNKGRCDVGRFGNTGSASAPLGMALANEDAQLKKDELIALLGIGSGITTMMMGIRW